MERHAGGLDSNSLSEAIKKRYGKDQAFSVPILMVRAIAGLLGERGWSRVPQLPLELACFPALVQPAATSRPSYALPALIGIGQARHAKRPSRNPVTRIFRDMLREATLQKLAEIQPSNGGFLEATPLTSFVTMSLIVAGQGRHTVTIKGLDFLERSIRADGSWPIDTNLSTWLTTLGVNAMFAGPANSLDPQQRNATSAWLIRQQFRQEHPYTTAAPGGWAWTDLPGGVPDADDTAGALLALRALTDPTPDILEAARLGALWLVNLQNRDGSMPTFCRGWGALPFDRSSHDLTAHALRAWQAWLRILPDQEARRVSNATNRAIRYLEGAQNADGSWAPLWFGNQHAADNANLTYGTARVLLALADLPVDAAPLAERAAERWLLGSQGADGGWGARPASIPRSKRRRLPSLHWRYSAGAAIAPPPSRLFVQSHAESTGWRPPQKKAVEPRPHRSVSTLPSFGTSRSCTRSSSLLKRSVMRQLWNQGRLTRSITDVACTPPRQPVTGWTTFGMLADHISGLVSGASHRLLHSAALWSSFAAPFSSAKGRADCKMTVDRSIASS